jgi:integrase
MESWERSIIGWAAEQRAAGKSSETITLWRRYLRRFANDGHSDPWSVTRIDMIDWLGRDGWAPSTRRSARTALRSFYRWGFEADLIDVDLGARLPKVRTPRGRPRPAPDPVIRAAIGTASRRVRLMLLLAGILGLRRGEISRVHSDDLVGARLRVTGKGGHVRDVPVPASLAALLRGEPPGWLFPSGLGGHLSAPYVGKLMSRALPGAWTAHTLRHAAASAWDACGLDLHEIAEVLGHASVRTTQIYVRVDTLRIVQGVEEAARRLTDPAA